jgi:hypothetical protein
MGNTFVNLKIDGDCWNGVPETARKRSAEKVMQALAAPVAIDDSNPINFRINTQPSVGAGEVCRLDLSLRLTAIAGTESAKLLSEELKRAVKLLSPRNKPGTRINIDISLSALLTDFYRAQNGFPALKPTEMGEQKTEKYAEAPKKPSDKKSGGKKK